MLAWRDLSLIQPIEHEGKKSPRDTGLSGRSEPLANANGIYRLKIRGFKKYDLGYDNLPIGQT